MARKNITDKRRQQILDALHKRLLIKPFDKTSIKEIAAEANINHGMLHYYFKNKEDILLSYIDYVIDLYKSMFEDWLRGNGQKFNNKEDFLKACLDFMLQKITLNKDIAKIYIELWEIGTYNEKVRLKLRETYEEWIQAVSKIVSDEVDGIETASAIGICIVAFSEGLSMLSIMLEDSNLKVEKLLDTFKKLDFLKLISFM